MLILTGDMNIDLLNPVCANTEQYSELLEFFHLEQLSQWPTRVSKRSSTLIDHIVTNCARSITHTAVLPCSVVSEHRGIFGCVNVQLPYQPRYKSIRHMKNFDETAFVNDLESRTFSLVYSSDDPKHLACRVYRSARSITLCPIYSTTSALDGNWWDSIASNWEG